MNSVFRERMLQFIMVLTIALALIMTGAVSSYALELHDPDNIVNPLVNIRQSIWDAVRFGTYPQTEIVAYSEQSGAYDRVWSRGVEFIVDEELYAKLQRTSFDSRGDATVDGTKYRRVKTPENYAQREEDYFWDGTPEYHYFRYDPIKWLVLEVSGGEVFLLAEDVLACMPAEDAGNWVSSVFCRDATIGDVRAELLEVDDIANTDKAIAYGFQKNPDQHYMVRWASSSTYAKACGCKTNWIVSNYEYSAASWILKRGSEDGYNIAEGSIRGCDDEELVGVRPAIRVSTDDARLQYAGKTRVLGGIIKQNQTINAPEEVEVPIGTTRDIGADAYTNLSYEIDDSEIATVSEDGVITPKKSGTAVVTICAEDTEEFSGAAIDVAIVVTPRVLKAPVMNSPKLTTYKKVKVTWQEVAGADSYEVQWKKAGETGWKTKKTFERSAVLDNLSAGSRYSVRVRAIEETEGPYTDIKTVTTLKKASTPTVKRYSSTKATVRWKTVAGATGYQFYSENMKSHRGSYVTRKTTSLKSTGLYKGIKYRYKVRAYKLVGGKRVYAPWSEYRIYRHG